MKCEGELINMTRAWDKEKFWVPDRNRTHDHHYSPSPIHQFHHQFTIIINLSLLAMNSIALILAVCGTPVIYDSIKWSCSPWVLVAQWIELPPGVRGAWVRFLSGTQNFLCPTLVSCWLFHLHIRLFSFRYRRVYQRNTQVSCECCLQQYLGILQLHVQRWI